VLSPDGVAPTRMVGMSASGGSENRRPAQITADYRRPHRRPPPDKPQTTTGRGK